MKKLAISIGILLFACTGYCQFPVLSMSTDLGIQRNFKEDQHFFTLAHTTSFQVHIDARDALYLWFAYSSYGKFSDDLVANAKSIVTIPQQISFTNKARMRFRHFSIGWKRYFHGAPDIEKGWNLYGLAGFGLLPGKIENTQSVAIDTFTYHVPVSNGRSAFKRLTFDIGVGYERPIGGDFYLYTEGKVWLPASDYPSKYIYNNSNAPFVGMISAGLRILFN